MKKDSMQAKFLDSLNFTNLFIIFIILLLLSVVYAKLADNPTSPDILERLQQKSSTDSYLTQYKSMQNLFIKERGWNFIIFSTLALSIILWMSISNRKQRRKDYLYLKYRINGRVERLVSERLDFQQRLHLKFEALTTNDLLVAEMLVDGLSSKDIASELNISPASANTARYRIRKRIGISSDVDLVSFLQGI